MPGGTGKDEKGFYNVLVLAHEDSAGATDNAEILRARINNANIKVPSSESTYQIYSKGSLVMAKVYASSTGVMQTLTNSLKHE